MAGVYRHRPESTLIDDVDRQSALAAGLSEDEHELILFDTVILIELLAAQDAEKVPPGGAGTEATSIPRRQRTRRGPHGNNAGCGSSSLAGDRTYRM